MKKKSNSKLKIIPLGGLEKIGMNITAFRQYQCGETWFYTVRKDSGSYI